MADIDLMPAAGVPFRAQVDANGIALGGTKTVLQLAQSGMRPFCAVDSNGLSGAVTIDQLAARGIRALCLVDENGLASGVTSDVLRGRGIRPLVALTSAGLSGSTTKAQLAARGLESACVVDETGAAGGGGPGAEATAFLARTTGLDTTHQNAYTALINGLVADGIWSKFDVLRIYATKDQTTALLNLVSSSYSGVLHGAPTFTADRGFTGTDGSTTVFIDSSFNASTAPTPKFTQNSCHLSTWTLNNTGMGSPDIGAQNSGGTSVALIYTRYSGDSHTYVRPQATGASGGDAGNLADKTGLIGANRSSSTQVDGYRNGASIYSNASTASTALINLVFTELGFSNAGTNQTGSGSQQAAASWGASLSATDWANFYSRVNTFLFALGPAAGAEASAFLARTSGLDFVHVNAYKALINGLVADGVWAKLDVLHIYATQDATTAKLNLISTSYPASPGPTPPTFAVDRGFTGVSASTLVFEDTGYTPTTSPGAQFTLNSAHLSMWSLTVGGVSADGVGVNSVAVICPRYTDNNCYASVNCGFSSMTVANGDGTGFYTANRSASNAQQLYRNGALFGSNTAATTTLANRNMLSVGNNNAGAGYGWGGQEAAITIGSSLSATDAGNLYARLRTYMTAVGVP